MSPNEKGPSNKAPLEILTEDDYFRKANEFRLWLNEVRVFKRTKVQFCHCSRLMKEPPTI
jgi:hypothetical protein